MGYVHEGCRGRPCVALRWYGDAFLWLLHWPVVLCGKYFLYYTDLRRLWGLFADGHRRREDARIRAHREFPPTIFCIQRHRFLAPSRIYADNAASLSSISPTTRNMCTRISISRTALTSTVEEQTSSPMTSLKFSEKMEQYSHEHHLAIHWPSRPNEN